MRQGACRELIQYNATLIINDRVDVAAALPSRVGLHVGQGDAKIEEARTRLGPGRLLGVSVGSPDEARAALDSAADYAGVGPCWATQSKAGITADQVLGLDGARATVAALARTEAPHGQRLHMPCVLIGGLNTHTAARTLLGATTPANGPDGIAVISAIVAQRDPARAAAELYRLTEAYCAERAKQTMAPRAFPAPFGSVDETMAAVATLFRSHRSDAPGTVPRPLIQTITSHVSSNLGANVALAFGASPIMSHEADEAEALADVIGALVLNIGTLSGDSRRGMAVAGPAANARGTPVVLDPVGAGATPMRMDAVQALLNQTQITLIKGNAAELGAMVGSKEVQAQGVDSVGTLAHPGHVAAQLAVQEGALVLLTGEVDYLSNGEIIIESRCGVPLLGQVTATGCSLGVVVAAGLAAAQHSYGIAMGDARTQRLTPPRTHPMLLLGVLMGLLAYTIAAEKAAGEPSVHGPGTFVPALLDALAAFDADVFAAYTHRVTVHAR